MPTIFGDVVEALPQKQDLGGIAFNNPDYYPVEAQHWCIDVLDGWDNTPEIEVFQTELGGNRDGSSDANFWPIRNRVLIVGGYVLAPTASRARELFDMIVGNAFPRNDNIAIIRHEDISKMVWVKRSGRVEVEWPLPNGFRWQTTLLASDPLKYALQTEQATAGVAGLSTASVTFPLQMPVVFSSSPGDSSDTAGVINRGNAPSRRIFAHLHGPLPRGAWRLRNDTTDQEITFDVGLTEDDELRIDFNTQTATLNGYPVSASVSGTFWEVVPGSNSVRLYADYDPDARIDLVVYSAWE